MFKSTTSNTIGSLFIVLDPSPLTAKAQTSPVSTKKRVNCSVDLPKLVRLLKIVYNLRESVLECIELPALEFPKLLKIQINKFGNLVILVIHYLVKRIKIPLKQLILHSLKASCYLSKF